MTDMHDKVVRPAAAEARDVRAHRRLYLGLAVMVLGMLVVAGLWVASTRRTAALELQVSRLSQQADQLAGDGQKLAEQVKSLGGTPVVQPPTAVGPSGPAGPAGTAGSAGRGITGTTISSGHLYVSYTDGTTEDKGQVQGQPGTPGLAGRSITSTTLAAGHLVLAYSDGSSSDVGAVVGKDGAPGRGVSSVAISSNSHLLVTYTDGTSADAGPLPRGETGPPGPSGPSGPPGASGARGAPPAGWTWTDELGRKQSCTRSGGSDDAPQYSCTAQPPVVTNGG